MVHRGTCEYQRVLASSAACPAPASSSGATACRMVPYGNQAPKGLTDHTLYAVRCMPRAIRCKPRADHRTLPTDRHCNAVATSHEDCCNSVQPSQVDHTTLPKTHATDADERLDSVLKALPDAVQELDGPKVP
jgi:hypothetical protein